MRSPWSRDAVETAERFADGLATTADLARAHHAAQLEKRRRQRRGSDAGQLRLIRNGIAAAREATRPDAFAAAQHTAFCASHAASLDAATGLARWDLEMLQQAELLRDIMGNPFRPAVVNPDWLAWNGAAVVKLARAIYEDRRWENMPILG